MDIPTIILVAGAPVAGLVGFKLAETGDSTAPWVAGFAVTVFTLLMVPVVKWMMNRMDGDRKEAVAAAIKREEREEKRQEAFVVQVDAMRGILRAIEDLSEHQKQIREVIDGLPDRIARNRRSS
jgi:flagellar biosynthesis/type III secretory pathway M-ring protein FliF/YscJ